MVNAYLDVWLKTMNSQWSETSSIQIQGHQLSLTPNFIALTKI